MVKSSICPIRMIKKCANIKGCIALPARWCEHFNIVANSLTISETSGNRGVKIGSGAPPHLNTRHVFARFHGSRPYISGLIAPQTKKTRPSCNHATASKVYWQDPSLLDFNMWTNTFKGHVMSHKHQGWEDDMDIPYRRTYRNTFITNVLIMNMDGQDFHQLNGLFTTWQHTDILIYNE